jgi:hypothetical protein
LALGLAGTSCRQVYSIHVWYISCKTFSALYHHSGFCLTDIKLPRSKFLCGNAFGCIVHCAVSAQEVSVFLHCIVGKKEKEGKTEEME